MLKKSVMATSVLALVAALTACGGGGQDGLIDGATDKPRDANSESAAQDVGPPTVPSQAAGPGSGNSASQPGVAAPGAASAGATLTLVPQGAKGPYLADGAGMALYFAEGDRDGSKCIGECLQAWPPVTMTTAQPSGGPGLQGAMIASITRPDGTRQVTYNGHPLYRYAADSGSGSTNGDGVKDKFATWHLMSPQGASPGGAHGASHGAGHGATAPGAAPAAGAGG